jgi:hypothetical protein
MHSELDGRDVRIPRNEHVGSKKQSLRQSKLIVIWSNIISHVESGE